MNRLAKERSAYLQHAKEQKIDWYPWSEEAFERARKENKPVFLSSGAVWCHWCHVMAHESFENEEVARLLNERFISVKLDRDERPDIDRRYQRAVASMGAGGGWPLSVFLTPEKKPFYGGTYFPLEEAHGRPGFKALLAAISDLYRERKGEVDAHSEGLLDALRPIQSPPGKVQEAMINDALGLILHEHDKDHGGFGGAPKFPMSGAIEFLINRSFLSKDLSLGEVAQETLRKMARGGIHDHLGGGFHRYSTDEEWIIPHFEKMTDDNAWLLRNYTNGYAAFRDPGFREIAEGIIRFFKAELSHPDGGFYASQDADVGPEDEGGYFTWTDEELKTVLDETEYGVLSLHFVDRKGSMRHDRSKKVLFSAMPVEEIGRQLGMEKEAVVRVMGEGREKLLHARQKREKPFIDTAMYTSLNGLAISAFLKAFRVFGVEDIRDFALKSIEKIMKNNVQDGALLHRPGIAAMLDDYVFFADALLDAYEVTGHGYYLETAKQLMDRCLEEFWDEEEGGFFDTAEEVVGMRLKGVEDMPHPSANSMAVMVLLKLSFACGLDEYRTFARRTIELFSGPARSMGVHGAYYFCALDAYFNLLELTLNLSPSSDLGKAAIGLFCPYETIRYDEEKGNVTACRRQVCFEPVGTVEELAALMNNFREG